MNTDTLAGIATATEDADMPRVVASFEDPDAGRVDIVEPVIGSEDGYRRGYLWMAVAGDHFLSPTRPGDFDPTRWVPGKAEMLPGGRLLATSRTSPEQAIRNARRTLRR